MARSGKSALGLMLVALIAVAILATTAYTLAKEATAFRYNYDATGVYTPEDGRGPYVLTGEMSITLTSAWGYERTSTSTDIRYTDHTNTTRHYDMGSYWDLSGNPECSKFEESVTGYQTANFGKVDVSVYSYTLNKLTIKRWIGQEDGIIYRSERIYEDATVTLELESYGPVSVFSIDLFSVPESLVLGVKNLR